MNLPGSSRCRGCLRSIDPWHGFEVPAFASHDDRRYRWSKCSCGTFTALDFGVGSSTVQEPYGASYPAYHSKASILRRFLLKGSWRQRFGKVTLPHSGNLLDFGFGSGLGLEMFVEIFGGRYRYYGADIADMRQDAVRERTEFILSDDLPSAARFTFINSSQSIEHVLDPGSTLRLLWAKLAPGGVMFLDTPNARAGAEDFPEWGGWHSPYHSCVLSTEAITDCLLPSLGSDCSVLDISFAPGPFIRLDTVTRIVRQRLGRNLKIAEAGKLFHSDLALISAGAFEMALALTGRPLGNIAVTLQKKSLPDASVIGPP